MGRSIRERAETTDRLVGRAHGRSASRPAAPLAATPRLRVAIVACMDARLMVEELFDLDPGEAHVIRNAGGVVTDDVIRSLAISQMRLGTREVMVVRHTDCGLTTFTDDEFRSEVLARTGALPTWEAGAFADLEAGVRSGVAEIARSPFIAAGTPVRGFVYDVHSQRLTEVHPENGTA